MKKILLLLVVLAAAITMTNAQDMNSKRGFPILPEAGDWSIGIDAVPFVDWAFDKTRIFSNTSVTSSGNAIRAQENLTLVGLYMVDADKAYRARVGINFFSHSEDHIIGANNLTGSPTAYPNENKVIDTRKTSSMGITLGAGIQKFRGNGRLKGIYGAEAVIRFMGATKNTYEYGNSFILVAGNDTAAFKGRANIYDYSTGTEGYVSSRTTESKTGSMFSFGVNGFIGAEYFFAPKMSFSAEYNWGISISSVGEGETTIENTVSPSPVTNPYTVKTTTSKTGKTSDFNVANGNIGTSSTGSVVFHFYF